MATVLAVAGCTGDPSTTEPSRADAYGPVREPAWRLDLGPDKDKGEVHVEVVGERVVVQAGSSVRVLDRRSGKEIWKHTGTEARIVSGDTVVARDGKLTAWDLATGRQLWQHPVADKWGSATVVADAVYTGDCTDDPYANCPLSRRDRRTGRPVWTVSGGQVPAVQAPDIGAVFPSELWAPQPGRYLVLLSGAAERRRAYAMDPATGERQGSVAFEGEPVLVTDRTLVVAGREQSCRRDLQGYDAVTGQRRWQATVFGYVGGTGDPPSCSALRAQAFAGSPVLGTRPATLLTTTEGFRPVALDLDTGQPRWQGDAAGIPLDMHKGAVLARERRASGRIVTLDPRTGRRVWAGPDTGDTTGKGDAGFAGEDTVLMPTDGWDFAVLTVGTDTSRGRIPGQSTIVGAGAGWCAGHHLHDGVIGFYVLD